MRVVEFTRFQVQPDQEAAMVAAQTAATAACRAQHRELQEVLLIRLDCGDWLDIAVWAPDSSGPQPIQADDDALPSVPARDDFFGHVEGLVGEERGVIVTHSLGAPNGKTHSQPERLEEIPQ